MEKVRGIDLRRLAAGARGIYMTRALLMRRCEPPGVQFKIRPAGRGEGSPVLSLLLVRLLEHGSWQRGPITSPHTWTRGERGQPLSWARRNTGVGGEDGTETRLRSEDLKPMLATDGTFLAMQALQRLGLQ